MDDQIQIVELSNSGDQRGDSFAVSIQWINDTFPLRNIHMTTTVPGEIRGNHYHAVQREILLVMYSDRWTLYWDFGAGTDIHAREFTGMGATAIVVPPNAAHAIRNDGRSAITIIGLTDLAYDASAPDVIPRTVATVTWQST